MASLDRSPVLAKRQHLPSDVIEELGVGPVQWRITVLCGLVSFQAGAGMMVLSSVNGVLEREWHLSTFQCGILGSVVHVGVCLGNLMGGLIGDRYGRKLPIVAATCSAFVICNLSLLSSGFWSNAIFLFVIGESLGVGQPGAHTMVSETTPGTWRIAFVIILIAFFTLGEIYSSLVIMLDDPMIVNLHWRVLVAIMAAPSAGFALLIGLFLFPSPIYLMSRGLHEEAARVLELMRRQNGLPDAPPRPTPQMKLVAPAEVTLSRQMPVIFGPRLFLTTSILCYLAFVMNLSYYGSLYAFPKVMVGSSDLSGIPAVSLLLGAVAELAGYVAFLSASQAPRIPCLMAGFCLACVCLVASAASNENTAALSLFGYHGGKLSSSLTFVTVYVYSAEVYPTMARALGSSLVCSSGRIGAIFGPSVVELAFWINGYSAFFWLAALLTLVAAPLIRMLPYETKGRALPEEDCGGVGLYGATGDESSGGA